MGLRALERIGDLKVGQIKVGVVYDEIVDWLECTELRVIVFLIKHYLIKLRGQ